MLLLMSKRMALNIESNPCPLLLEASLLGIEQTITQLEAQQELLQREKERIQELLKDLGPGAKLTYGGQEVTPETTIKGRGKKRNLTPEARAKIKAAQKKRWTKVKEALAAQADEDTPPIQEAKAGTDVKEVSPGKGMMPN